MRAAVFVLSAAVLAHEVCLLRALAIATYGHAASLVVSVALLGFGAAATLLALVPSLRRPTTVAACAALYAVAAPVSFRLASAVDFNVLQVGWDPTEWFRLLALQAIFVVPFLLAALGIAVALALWASRAGTMYAANLLGSGMGAVLAAPLLGLGPPEAVLGGLAVAAAAGGLFVPGRTAKAWGLAGAAVALALAGAGLPMSPFKDLAAAPGRRILETRHGPRGRVDLAAVPALHDAPGLSLVSTERLPPQDGLFVDGHLVASLDRGPSTYLDDTVGALPFLGLPADPRVLLLGVGPDLERATVVVEPNADLLDLAGVEGIATRPRAFLRDTDDSFDAVLLHVSPRAAVRETPLLTVEGLSLALSRVRDDGVLAVSTRLTTPARQGLKLLRTAECVTEHVVAVRSMDRLTVVLRHRPPTDEERAAVETFCARLGFDIVRPLADRPVRPHHETKTPLLVPGPDYPFDVRPATDARPYFHRFFRWSRLGDLLDRNAIPFVQWGFVALLVAFVQVVALALLLLLAPLVFLPAARAPALLFLALGAAWMGLEMAFLAQATVRLGSPTLAAAAVLGGFLVGSGLGSLAGERLGRPLRRASLAAALLALPLLYALPGHALLVGLVSAAVAFPMGMPFPAALSRLPAPSVPWALAVNGCASVVAAAAAPLLSSTFSITATAGAAAATYALVAIVGARAPRVGRVS